MNFAVLQIPDFALHALRRDEAALAGQPLALVAGEGRHQVLTQVSAEAAGLTPGVPAALALARCPGLLLRPRAPAAEVEAQRLLLAAAGTLAPRVEATEPGLCTVDLQGAAPERTAATLRRQLVALAAAGLPARAGLAATPLLARYAATQADPVLVVHEARAFLAPLPLALAAPTPAHAALLRDWGVRTLGELTTLPKATIAARLGATGVALWERAAGEPTRPLHLAEPPRSFLAEWAYEPPVESLEPLQFKLRRYAERIALELRAAGRVAAQLHLTLRLEDGTAHAQAFALPAPGADVASWLRVLDAHLTTVRTAARVAGVRLAAAPARPPVRQEGLFDTGLTDPPAFWENLARVAALVGEDRVGTPELADTHRPDACTLVRPAESVPAPEPPPSPAPAGLVLRRCRPPRPVRVTLHDGRPARLADGPEGGIRAVCGPWRLSGDWWRPEAWATEWWWIELETGGVHQLARTTAGWHLEGSLE